jgi:WD40 repeat protein
MSQDSFVEAVVVSADGQWIATTGSDKTVRVWSASTGAELFQIPLRNGGTALAFSPDAKSLITGDSGGNLRIWDISSAPNPLTTYQLPGLVGDIQYDATGTILGTSDDKRVWVLNPNPASSPTITLQGDPNLELDSTIKEIEFGADSNWLAASTSTNQVFIDGPATEPSIETLGTSGVIEAVVYFPSRDQFITATSFGLVQAWKYRGNESAEPETLLEDETVQSLAVDGSLLAIGVAEKVIVLDLSGSRENVELTSTGDNFALTFSAGGSMLASASSSGEIHLWQIVDRDFTLSHTLQKAGATSIALNSTGTTLAVGTTNSTLLIHTTSGEEWTRIPHAESVTGVAFSAEENTLTTASGRFVQLWDVSTFTPIKSEALFDAACSRMIENLDEALWSALFGSREYQLLCPDL